VSRYPSADLDLAFVVGDAVPAADVEATIRRATTDRLETVDLFDVFRGPQLGDGRRSLAYRLRLAAPDHTLTDAELAELRSAVIEAVRRDHAADLRG
jgi:phenylalanyl-tRNA synthetase beta chain